LPCVPNLRNGSKSTFQKSFRSNLKFEEATT
jgi:hypothetical protein